MVELRWCQYVTNLRAGPRKKLQYRVQVPVIDSDDYKYMDWSEWKDVPTYRQPYKRQSTRSKP